ncbi:MAG: tetratricopeptide repeat protein [Thiolinea sp.]
MMQKMKLSSTALLGGLLVAGSLMTTTAAMANTINSEIQANGSIVISKNGQVVTLIDAATTSSLGLETATLNLLLGVLEQQKVPLNEWPQKLSEIVTYYQALVVATDSIQAADETLQPLKVAVKQAVRDVDLEQAGILFNEIRNQSMNAEPPLQLTAAEADAANGARALTQLSLEEAGDYYLRASSMMEIMGEKYHEKWSHYADMAGTAFRDAGFYAEADALLTTAFSLREKYVSDSQLMTTSLNKLADIKRLMGHYDKALPLYKLVQKQKEATFGAQHAQVAIAINNVADIYRLKQDFAQALPLYQRALNINRAVLGNEHPDVATTMNNLAGLYEATGKFEQALALYEEALTVNEKIHGEDHPSVATTLNNLAGLYRALGKFETALPLYQRDLAISRKSLGENHPDVATTLNNLGILYFHMEDFVQSAEYLEQALRIFRLKLGINHPNTASVEESLVVIREKLSQ